MMQKHSLKQSKLITSASVPISVHALYIVGVVLSMSSQVSHVKAETVLPLFFPRIYDNTELLML